MKGNPGIQEAAQRSAKVKFLEWRGQVRCEERVNWPWERHGGLSLGECCKIILQAASGRMEKSGECK